MHLIELENSLKSQLLPPLRKLGYKFTGIEDTSTKAIPEWVIGSFINKNANRTVDISYSPAQKDTRELLNCHISTINFKVDRFDYTSTNQMTVPVINISEIHKEFNERLKMVLESISIELKQNFMPVLNGDHFKTEHVDWQGLK